MRSPYYTGIGSYCSEILLGRVSWAVLILQLVKQVVCLWHSRHRRKGFQKGLQLGNRILAPVLLEIEVHQLQMRLPHSCVQLQGRAQALLRFSKLASSFIQGTLKETSESGIRPALQSRGQRPFGLGIAACQHQHVSQVKVSLRVVLIEPDHFLKLLFRRLEI